MGEEYTPTQKEIENGRSVLSILVSTAGLVTRKLREDLFEVEEPETGLQVIVDAEESVVVVFMEVMDAPAERRTEFFEALLTLNNETVHGAFCLSGGSVLIKENLEMENLDPNELISAVKSIIFAVDSNADVLESFQA